METIRRGTDSTLMKIVFGAIVLVFVFWGVGAQGPTSVTIAQVNGMRITDTQFQRVMRRIDSSGAMDEAEAKRVQQQVIDELVTQEVLLQTASDLGIEVSDTEIAAQVLQIDAFKGDDGKFSTKLYERNLKRMGLTQGGFEEQLRQDLTLDKLQDVVLAGVHVTDAELERRFREESTRLDLSWVRISDAALLSHVPVDDAAIDAFLTDNAEAVKRSYDEDFDRIYSEPRKATVSSILLRADMDQGAVPAEQLQAKMSAILEEARGGADFAELAKRYSEDLTAMNGGAQGTMSEPQMDKAVANAVFATEAGKVTDIVETGRGLQILKVDEIIPEKVTPLEDVQRDIARNLIADAEVSKVADDFAQQVLDAWKAEGAAPSALLDEKGLSVETSLAVSPSRPLLTGAGTSPELLGALSTVSAEGVLDAVYPTDGGRIVAAVTNYQAPDMDLFETDKEMLRARVLAMEKQMHLEAWRKDAVARAEVEQLWYP